jgi:hypothetical protein
MRSLACRGTSVVSVLRDFASPDRLLEKWSRLASAGVVEERRAPVVMSAAVQAIVAHYEQPPCPPG